MVPMSPEYIRMLKDRLETVPWNNSAIYQPLLTAVPAPNPLSKADLRKIIKITMGNLTDTMKIIDKGSTVSGDILVNGLGDDSKWYLNSTIRDILRVAERLVLLRKVKEANPPSFRGTLVNWGFAHNPEKIISEKVGLFIEEFGVKDAGWRTRTYVGNISTTSNCHFATIAVFGPQRLAVIYDSAGGTYDHAMFRKVGPTLLT